LGTNGQSDRKIRMKLTLVLERIKAENVFEIEQHFFGDLKPPSFETPSGIN